MYNYTSTNIEEQNYWISYTDLVTGFMIIFIILTLILFNREQDKITVDAKYEELSKEFEDRLKGIEEISITDYATIRFNATNGNYLFKQGGKDGYYPTTYFEGLIDKFIPIYFETIQAKVFNENVDSITIKELRIEGHTDSTGEIDETRNYLTNLRYSSGRAQKVQSYILERAYFERLNDDFKTFIKKNSIAVGYSNSFLLDDDGLLVDETGALENEENSRRVEFRILLEKKAK